MIQDVALSLADRIAAWPLFFKILIGFAFTAAITDIVLKRFAPDSVVYARFRHGMEAVAAFWTAIILSIVYFLSVALVNIGLRVAGKDPLDRSLAPEPTFWRPHDPNPLGTMQAARVQF